MAWEGRLAQGLGQKCVWVLCAKIRVCWIWGCLRTRTRKQIPLTAALEETSGKGTTQDYAECLLAQTQLSFTVSWSNLLLFGGTAVWGSWTKGSSLESRASNVTFPAQLEWSP